MRRRNVLEVNSNERVMADSPRLKGILPGYRRVSSAHYADASPLEDRLTQIRDEGKTRKVPTQSSSEGEGEAA